MTPQWGRRIRREGLQRSRCTAHGRSSLAISDAPRRGASLASHRGAGRSGGRLRGKRPRIECVTGRNHLACRTPLARSAIGPVTPGSKKTGALWVQPYHEGVRPWVFIDAEIRSPVGRRRVSLAVKAAQYSSEASVLHIEVPDAVAGLNHDVFRFATGNRRALEDHYAFHHCPLPSRGPHEPPLHGR